MQEFKSKNFRIVFEHIGEGYDGEYNPQNKDDKPLLRLDLFYPKESNDEPIRNGSFCTCIPEGTSNIKTLAKTILNHAEELLLQHTEDNIGTISRIIGLYSWYDENSDFNKKAN